MSGTTFPYGDRPITRQGTGGGYATNEFLQFLERLGRSNSAHADNSAQLQAQINTNTTSIGALNSEVSSLTTGLATTNSTVAGMNGQISVLNMQVPAQVTVAAGAAVALTSGTVAQITTETAPAPAIYILIGTVYFSGTGTITAAVASTGLTAGAISTDPGAFVTGIARPPGISPSGVDLCSGSFVQLLSIGTPGPVYLNVEATFTGAISAYGSLIVWRVQG